MDPGKRRLWVKRVGWLVVYWVAGVVGLGVLAGALKVFMRAAGLAA